MEKKVSSKEDSILPTPNQFSSNFLEEVTCLVSVVAVVVDNKALVKPRILLIVLVSLSVIYIKENLPNLRLPDTSFVLHAMVKEA